MNRYQFIYTSFSQVQDVINKGGQVIYLGTLFFEYAAEEKLH